MDYKECNYCSEDKDLCEFRERTDGTLYAYCLDCEKFVKRRDRKDSIEQKKCKKCKKFKDVECFGDYKNRAKKIVCKDCEESMNNKRCNNCGEVKKIDNFRLRKHNNTYYSRCIPCEREQTRARRARNRKTPEEINKEKKKQDETILNQIMDGTGLEKKSAKKVFSHYERIMVSEFSHIIDVPDCIEKKTLQHVIEMAKKKKSPITKEQRVEVEKKVSIFIKKNKEKGLTLDDTHHYRQKMLNQANLPLESL